MDIHLESEKYQAGSLPEVFQLVGHLDKKLKHFETRSLRESDLTPPQYYILTLLAEKNERPFKELAEALACTRATVTGIVDTLEKKRLARRVPSSTDRRSMLVRLTKEGRAVVQATPAMGSSFTGCCDTLDLEETQELSRLLKKLIQALNF